MRILKTTALHTTNTEYRIKCSKCRDDPFFFARL